MIKTIIFDFGDIFINLDKPATFRELEKLKVEDYAEKIRLKNFMLETGKLSSEEFIEACRTEFNVEEADMVNCWNAILVDFPRYRYQFIKKLSVEKNYQLILLSNTNGIHIEWVKNNVPFFEEFRKCFDAFYLSHEINFRKPNSDIFEFVLKKHKLKPEECLFIDDTKENTNAAAALGLHVWNLEPTREDVIDLFTTKGDLF